MSDLADRLLLACAAAIIGTIAGWAGTALTLSGRVDSLEKSGVRIEGKLDAVLEAQRENTAKIIRETK